MSVSDPIANALTKIRNAVSAGHETVEVKEFRIMNSILETLVKEGYIRSFSRKREHPDIPGVCIVTLKKNGSSVTHEIKRISKPSRRVYAGYQDIPSVMNNFGTMIVSTSRGILTGKQARKQKVGGELLFSIW